MELTIRREDLNLLLKKQLASNFMFNVETESKILDKCVKKSLVRVENCFSCITNKYYNKKGAPYFNPFHSGQYSIFLYYLSNTIWNENGKHILADKVYYLNKLLNCLDLYYEVIMPDIFFLDHPVGSVLGRANYSNYFAFTQNCTVGNNKGIFPSFSENVKLLSGSKVIGNSKVGNNVIISANAYVKDENIPSNSVVFGSSPNLVIKTEEDSYFQRWFICPHQANGNGSSQ